MKKIGNWISQTFTKAAIWIAGKVSANWYWISQGAQTAVRYAVSYFVFPRIEVLCFLDPLTVLFCILAILASVLVCLAVYVLFNYLRQRMTRKVVSCHF